MRRLSYGMLFCKTEDKNVQLVVLQYLDTSPSWEDNRPLAGQEIPRILWNPKFRYRIRTIPPPVPVLSQIKQFHAPIPLVDNPF